MEKNMALNDVIFDDVKFSDILKEIHHKCNDKNKQIEQLINDLKKFIKKLDDATVIAPLIKEYLDVDVDLVRNVVTDPKVDKKTHYSEILPVSKKS